jgi:hypothetical protein
MDGAAANGCHALVAKTESFIPVVGAKERRL